MAHLPAVLALAAALAAGESPPADPAAPVSPAPAGAAREASAAPAAERETTADLVQRCLNVYGGSRARIRLGRVRVAGLVSSSLHPGESGQYTRTFVRGRGLRLEVGYADGDPEVRVLDGARAFRYGEPAPRPVIAALQLEAARLDLPALLLDREAAIQDQGEVQHEGQTLRVLGLEIAAGARLEVGIDQKTARILYVRGLVQSGPRQLELFTVFRNFRVVDGVLIPFREEGYANGEPTGDVDLRKVEFLDDVPESVFEP